MNEEPEIILKLTPRQAACLHAMTITYSWTKGSRGKEVREIYDMLAPRVFAFGKYHVLSFSPFGHVKGNEVLWLDEDPENKKTTG